MASALFMIRQKPYKIYNGIKILNGVLIISAKKGKIYGK